MRYPSLGIAPIICVVVLVAAWAQRSSTTLSQNQNRASQNEISTNRGEQKSSPNNVIDAALKSGDKKRTGVFSNEEYGYTVTIPKGIVAVSPPSPYPQHGFRVPLLDQPESQIWVEGAYNSAMYLSSRNAVEQDLTYLQEETKGVEITKSEQTSVQKMDATRVVARYKSEPDKTTMIQDVLMALRRSTDPDEPEVIYTIRLRTPESRYSSDRKIVDALIATLKLKALPK